MCLFNNMSVRSLWKLCARALAHSLEGALGTTPKRPLQIRDGARGEQAGQVPPKFYFAPPNNFCWTLFLTKFHAFRA